QLKTVRKCKRLAPNSRCQFLFASLDVGSAPVPDDQSLVDRSSLSHVLEIPQIDGKKLLELRHATADANDHLDVSCQDLANEFGEDSLIVWTLNDESEARFIHSEGPPSNKDRRDPVPR